MTKDYGTIAIFKVNNKKGDTWPDYNGKIKITEAMQPGEYDVGIYISEPKNGGSKYQRGKIRDAWKKPTVEEVKDNVTKVTEEDLDSIPF